jgi:sigma-B regulation protein RsbU (phosphoserine phosphatase)
MNYAYLLASFHLAFGGLILLLSVVMLRENPRNRLNWLLALVLFFAGLGATIGSSDFLMPQIDPKASRERVDLVVQFSYLWEFFFPTLLVFALSFPTHHPILRVRHVGLLLFVPHLAHFAFGAIHALTGDTFGIPAGPEAASAWAIPRALAPVVYRLHRNLFVVVNLAYLAASLAVLIQRTRGASRPRVRDQLTAIGWGMGIASLLYLWSTVTPKRDDAASNAFRQTLLLLSLLTGAGSIAYAMVRYRFLDASLIVRRTILYAVSTAAVLGLYVVAITQVERLLRAATGFETPIFRGLVFVMALILYQPLLAKMEETLESVLLRDRSDHRTALRALSGGLVTSLDPDELGRMVVSGLSDSLLTSTVALVRYEGPDARPVVASAEGLPSAGDLLSAVPEPREVLLLDPLTPFYAGAPYFLLPLRHQDQALGLIVLGPKIAGGRYTREDETFLSAIANQVSTALKTAEFHADAVRRAGLQRDIENARRIQQSFLPARFPARPGIDVCGHHIPSREVGGDYYDVLEQGDGAIFLAVADVSGKGMPAAMLASMLQAALRTQVVTETSPAQITSRLNHLVCGGTAQGQFATFFLARYELAERRLTYANAGHNFPVVARRSGSLTVLDHSDLVLGCLPNTTYDEKTLTLDAGDHLLLYTDGISEAAVQGREFDMLGEDGLLDLLRGQNYDQSASEFVDQLRERFEAMTDRVHEADDMTLLLLRIPEAGTPPPRVRPPEQAWHAGGGGPFLS